MLAILTFVGAGLRLACAWDHNRTRPDDTSRLVGDEYGYEGLGYDLTQGYFFLWPGRVPAYPAFIAVTYKVMGARSPASVLYAQAMFGSLAVPLAFFLARRFMRTNVAPLFAAGIVALDPALIFQVRWLYSEAVFTPLLLLTTIALCAAASPGGVIRSGLSGVALAILNLTRATGGLMPGLLLVAVPRKWTINKRLASAWICGLAMAACIAPWTWHNYKTYDRFLPLASSTAVLWQGCPEYYNLVRSKSYQRVWQEELNPKWNGGHDPFSIDGDRYFTRRAIDSIKAEPKTYAKYCAKKAAYFWVGNPLSEFSYLQMMDREQVRQLPLYDWIGKMIARNLPFVGLIACLVLLVRGRLMKFAVPLAVIAYFWAVHTVTATEIRFSEPLHPLLAVLIAGAFSRFPTRDGNADPRLD